MLSAPFEIDAQAAARQPGPEVRRVHAEHALREGVHLLDGVVMTGFRRRGCVLVLAVVVVVAAGLGGADAAGVFGSPKPAVTTSGYATGTAVVT